MPEWVYDNDYYYHAYDERFTDEIIEKLRKDGVIFKKGGVVGVKVSPMENCDTPMITLLVEDDGSLYGKDYQINSYWIDNMIEVLKETKKYIEENK